MPAGDCNKYDLRSESVRACSPAKRAARNLRLTSEVLCREGLLNETFDDGGQWSCEGLQKRWKEWIGNAPRASKGRDSKHRLSLAIKGTKTLFDEPCKLCDKQLSDKAKADWSEKAFNEEQVTAPEVIEDIKKRVRRIMGKRWWERRRDSGPYVPDQQGCYELERGCGGSLSVTPSDMPFKEPRTVCEAMSLVRENPEDRSRCRLGSAKSKGKIRIVTMQSAGTKPILRPVHEAAYDRLSAYPWLVRGDVTREHFLSLGDLGPGWLYRSGDYEASTDNLNKDAVMAVVEVLGESLPDEERNCLVESFRSCEVVYDGKLNLVVRGSMMGNLCSFVVLCLLNRVCYERAWKLAHGRTVPHNCLINGDDILFKGDRGLYQSWLHCTSEVGFVINRTKTMSCERYGDLNSQTFDYKTGRLLRKLCFGFLASDSWKEPEGSLASPLFELCDQVSFGTATWLLSTRQVRSLFFRVPPPLSQIPRRWWSWLIKKRWFRDALNSPEPTVMSVGVERKLPFVNGPPLISTDPEIEADIQEATNVVTRLLVEEWIGVPVHPIEKKIPACGMKKEKNSYRLGRERHCWQRLWVKPVLDVVMDKFPHILHEGTPDWVDDQPGLSVKWRVTRKFHDKFAFAPRLFDVVPLLTEQGAVNLCA